MTPFYGALLLNFLYLLFRLLSMVFNWFEPGDFLGKMPIFPVLIFLPVLQFFVVQHFLKRIKKGEVVQTSVFSAYKEGRIS